MVDVSSFEPNRKYGGSRSQVGVDDTVTLSNGVVLTVGDCFVIEEEKNVRNPSHKVEVEPGEYTLNKIALWDNGDVELHLEKSNSHYRTILADSIEIEEDKIK